MNVSEAKARFSGLMQRVQKGEQAIICNRNVTIAKIEPLSAGNVQKRHRTEIGWAQGRGVKILGDITVPAMAENDWNMLA